MGQARFSIPTTSRQRWSVEEYLALDETGVFDGKGRFELIDGEIYKMSPLYRPHGRATTIIAVDLTESIRSEGLDLEVLAGASMRLGENSLPEPDMVVAGPDPDAKFVERDVTRIAIEISYSSLRHDLKRKATLYAKHGIPEYWVLDLRRKQFHQMSDPTAKGYAAIEVHPFGTRITSKVVPQIQLDTARLA